LVTTFTLYDITTSRVMPSHEYRTECGTVKYTSAKVQCGKEHLWLAQHSTTGSIMCHYGKAQPVTYATVISPARDRHYPSHCTALTELNMNTENRMVNSFLVMLMVIHVGEQTPSSPEYVPKNRAFGVERGDG
jgi:hypothetical protein